MFSNVEKLEIKVPAHIDYLGDLRDFVMGIGKRHGFSDKHLNAFKLAVDEAATNIIRHAYRDSEGAITIRARVRQRSLTLSIIDQGTYFDPKRVSNPDLNRYVDIGKKGGLGIFIMRKLMDEIDYRRTEEGNELRITKYREAEPKKKILDAVGKIPFSIKAKYFVRTMAAITAIIAATYFYFFFTSASTVRNDFMAQVRDTNAKIINRINSAPEEEFSFLDNTMQPIYEEYNSLVHHIVIVDSSGLVTYSSDVNELFGSFKRPEEHEVIDVGMYKYDDRGTLSYEVENPIIIKETGKRYGTAHLLFSAEGAQARIREIRLNNLQLALVIFVISGLGVALLIYLVMNPFRKLSEWVRNLGHGEIEDDIEVDSESEIGEIAQAFSGITQKLRESEKNLADQERLQKEMQVAQEIQQTLLPMDFPHLEGYQLAAHYEAAKEVGGDYYDFVEVDKDTLGIAVADVSGKGVPGSLVMTMIRTALRTEARGMKDAAKVLARVNNFVSNDIKKGMFVTVFYLIIDSKKRSLNYASAGHNPMILYRPSTEKTYYLNPRGFPIGVQLPEKDYFSNYIESDTIQLAKDDILLLYTDGITEAMNARRQLFGEERLQKILGDFGHLTAAQFVEKLKEGIHSFTEGEPQYDDITLVTVKEESNREQDEYRRAKEAHDYITAGVSVKDACDRVNLTTYAYYNKYKKVFEEEGVEAFEVEESNSVEAKHLSIEEKTKIFDIIANNPEYGAGRIREELNTEKYGYFDISESRIYDELVRSRLNTRQLREAHISKIKRSRRRMKPPGTPFMSLDGTLIMNRQEQTRPTPQKESDEEEASDADRHPPTSRREKPETPESRAEPSKPQRKTGGAESESDALLGTSLDELLARVDDDSVESDFEDLTDDTESTDAYASLDEMLAEEDETDGFDDDEDEGQDTAAEVVDEHAADYDFEEILADGDDLTEVDPQQSDFDEGAESDAAEEEVEPTEVTSGDSSDLTASSIDELLAETEQEEFSSEEDEGEVAESQSAVDDEDEEISRSEISFSDLIQSIDDEIVYISDFDHHKQSRPKKSREAGIAEMEHNGKDEEKDNESEPGGVPQDAKAREKVLINGIRYYKSNDFDNAITEFKRIIKIYPEFKEAHSILGNAYFRRRLYKEAANEYDIVKRLDPQDVTAYENMGVIYANQGAYKQAVGEWKKVLELNPNRPDIEDKIRKALRMLN